MQAAPDGAVAAEPVPDDFDINAEAPAWSAVSRTPAVRPPVVFTSVCGLMSVVFVGEAVGLIVSLPSFAWVCVNHSTDGSASPSADTAPFVDDALAAIMNVQSSKLLFCV